MSKFLSRKLTVVVGGLLITLGSALHGDITWTTAVQAVVGQVIAYLVAQGTQDAITAAKG
jgi:hypothetical protein